MIQHHSPEQSSTQERMGRMEGKIDALFTLMQTQERVLKIGLEDVKVEVKEVKQEVKEARQEVKEVKKDVCAVSNVQNMWKGAILLLWRAGSLVTAIGVVIYFLITKFPHWFFP